MILLQWLVFLLVVVVVWLACEYIDLKKALTPREKRHLDLLNVCSSIIDRVEGYDSEHSKEVADFALKIASNTSLKEEQIASLEIAAKLHDIGMLIISGEFIKSSAKLDSDGLFVMKNHPLLAEHYLKKEMDSTDEIPSIIRWHHERWDGFGYPDSLRGEEIPLQSRILAIADSVSAMRNPRNYRKKKYASDREIAVELKRQSGLQFDPSLVKIALSLLEIPSDGVLEQKK